MEARLLVNKGRRSLSKAALALSSAMLLLGAHSNGVEVILSAAAAKSGAAEKRQEIRFYKANRSLQTDRIWFTKKKGRAPGCHDFLKKTRVYKVVQFGFGQCTVYSQNSCAAGSQIAASHDDSEQASTLLGQGFGWILESEHKRGAKLRSWSCQ